MSAGIQARAHWDLQTTGTHLHPQEVCLRQCDWELAAVLTLKKQKTHSGAGENSTIGLSAEVLTAKSLLWAPAVETLSCETATAGQTHGEGRKECAQEDKHKLTRWHLLLVRSQVLDLGFFRNDIKSSTICEDRWGGNHGGWRCVWLVFYSTLTFWCQFWLGCTFFRLTSRETHQYSLWIQYTTNKP